MEEDQTDQPGEESVQEPKTEEEEGGGEKAEGDEESIEKDGEDKEDRGQEAGKDEDLTTPADKGHKPKVCMSKIFCTYMMSIHMVLLLCHLWDL